MPKRPVSPFVAGYIFANRHLDREHPIAGPEWVTKSERFSIRVALIGASVFLLIPILPPDSKRWVIAGLAAIVVAAGIWLRLNARRIFDAAQSEHELPYE